jgi:hypothetical protein
VIVATKDAEWAYYALYNIPGLTKAQRTRLVDVIATTKDANWTHSALRNIRDLTEAQRSALQKIAR